MKHGFWKEFFLWLERNLPKFMAAFGLGYKVGSGEKAKVEKQLKEKEYENDKLKNESAVRDGATGRDVTGDFIKRNQR